MKRYDHLAVFTAMVHDSTVGRVRPDGDLGLSIEYWPNEGDRRELLHGVASCVRLLFAAGARRVLLPTHPPRVYERGMSFEDIEALDLVPGLFDITSVHPMGSVPMGDVPSAAVSSEGKHHHLRGLFIADGSLFPSSIGVPPQLSIYALGLHVGRAVLRG
jgi:choline dehydrogenase-like flavoprotein